MEQQHTGAWLGRGKVTSFQDGAVGGLQVNCTRNRRLLRLGRGRGWLTSDRSSLAVATGSLYSCLDA